MMSLFLLSSFSFKNLGLLRCEKEQSFLSNFECHSKSFILKAVNFLWQSSTLTSLPCNAGLTNLTDSKTSTKNTEKSKNDHQKSFLCSSGFTSYGNSCISFHQKNSLQHLPFKSHLTRVWNK